MFKHYWTKYFSSGSNVPHILKYRRVYIKIYAFCVCLTLHVSLTLIPCHMYYVTLLNTLCCWWALSFVILSSSNVEMVSLNNDSVYKTQCPSKKCLNGYLYNAVLEKFWSSIYAALGRAGLDSRMEDDVWCVCCSQYGATAHRITNSDCLGFGRPLVEKPRDWFTESCCMIQIK